jgi:single-stranded-DNA-specific exonuclease
MLKKRWLIKEKGDTEKVKQLAEVLNVDEKIANLLVHRGIETYEQARVFFRPEISDLHDPFKMQDMHKAVERLCVAINKEERILVYGDYDVDGTTAIALVYSFIKEFYPNIDYYVPDRYAEGYGISFTGLDYAIDNSFSLMIAVDCGIKAVEKVKYAKEKGLDVIICDHHTPGDEIPAAAAVLDPKRGDCEYPFKELSGCGVAFKFLQAYSIANNLDFNKLQKYLDLVVVSIGSDIVPVIGENRILSYFGLQQINTDPCEGLKSIIDITGLGDKEIQITDIVFKIGPRINATGRIDSGSKSVDLLISKDKKYSDKIAIQINSINTSRQELDHDITDKALDMISNSEVLKNSASTVVFSPDWHKGVIGIVASRLTETYYRPTVVFTQSNGVVTGSARSIPGYNLYEAIEHCSDLLENFGGHMYAAGLSLKPENLEKFSEKFENFVQKTLREDLRTPVINVDMELELKDITPKFYRILKQFAPFGPENMTPVFCTKNIYDNGSMRKVGKNQEHLKLKIVQHLGDNRCVDAIGFSFSGFFDQVSDYKPFDICYQIFENKFMNKTFLQILIKDIHKENTTE